MYQPIYDFLILLKDNFLEPIRQALHKSGIFDYFFNYFNSLINAIFNTNNFNFTMSVGTIASIITIIIAILCFNFVIKLFKNAFSIILNIFNDQLAIPEKRRRKRKWNFLN